MWYEQVDCVLNLESACCYYWKRDNESEWEKGNKQQMSWVCVRPTIIVTSIIIICRPFRVQ